MRELKIIVAVAAVGGLLQGCGGASGNGDPGAKALPMGESCQSIRSQLNALDARGVPAYVQRQSTGGSLTATQKADADKYNQLLNQYLGARCHV